MAPLALGLAYPGFLLLSLAMDRHHRELLQGRPDPLAALPLVMLLTYAPRGALLLAPLLPAVGVLAALAVG